MYSLMEAEIENEKIRKIKEEKKSRSKDIIYLRTAGKKRHTKRGSISIDLSADSKQQPQPRQNQCVSSDPHISTDCHQILKNNYMLSRLRLLYSIHGKVNCQLGLS